MAKSRPRPRKARIVTATEKVDTTPPVEQTEGTQAPWAQGIQSPPNVTAEPTKPEAPQADDDGMVDLFMLTGYRDFAQKGQVYRVDAGKAQELIRLKRAVVYDKKLHKGAGRAN